MGACNNKLKDSIEKETITSPKKSSKKRSKSFTIDLRIHTPASIGYFGIEGVDTAPAMVSLAKVKGIDLIAVTDFYTGEYIDKIMDAAKDTPVTIIPGVDIRCSLNNCDDVVLTCLFPETFGSTNVQDYLHALDIPKSVVGNRKYLVRKSFDTILQTLEDFGGVALPSRMDKTPHRLSVLPALIQDYGFRTFDLAYADSTEYFKAKWPKIKFNLFSFSNANSLAQLGSRTAKVKMSDATFQGLAQLTSRV
ncbi:MAG: hypothetical protein H6619_01220 [Deltaproteobacteria bacterium]|nr:hypothetical protein [Deltaproteobacteria bacterium]